MLTASYKARVAMEDVDRVFDLVNFRHTGNVDVNGAARFVSIDDYRVSGSARGAGLGYGDVQNMSVSATFVGDQKELKIDAIRLAALGGSLRATGTAHDFQAVRVGGQYRWPDCCHADQSGWGEAAAVGWRGGWSISRFGEFE